MSDTIQEIYPSDRRGLAAVDALLAEQGLTRDAHLDYTCAIFDDDSHAIATGSCFGNTLRCLAISEAARGDGLFNSLISQLMDVQYRRGHMHLFVYTKLSTAKFFRDLGFYPIATVADKLVFMENRRTGFSDYLTSLQRETAEHKTAGNADTAKPVGAIVMNGNPFTLGHQYLVETAAKECSLVHLFIVSEDAGPIPAAVRKRLIQEGVSHLPNVICHDTANYLISQATFHGYFLPDSDTVATSQAILDAQLFTQIAKTLHITKRFVGTEPTSNVTALYNRVIGEELPKVGIECVVIPRRTALEQPISASTVRVALRDGDWSTLAQLVPQSTLNFFQSPEGEPVLAAIRSTENLIHH